MPNQYYQSRCNSRAFSYLHKRGHRLIYNLLLTAAVCSLFDIFHQSSLEQASRANRKYAILKWIRNTKLSVTSLHLERLVSSLNELDFFILQMSSCDNILNLWQHLERLIIFLTWRPFPQISWTKVPSQRSQVHSSSCPVFHFRCLLSLYLVYVCHLGKENENDKARPLFRFVFSRQYVAERWPGACKWWLSPCANSKQAGDAK